MSLKDVICKEYKYLEIIPYQLKSISMGKVEFFVPIAYERLDDENIKLCYDVSEMNRIAVISNDGGEAPYIALSLINGMREAMDYYIFPSQYLLREKLVYICKDRSIKLAFVPEVLGEMPLKDPARKMRKMTYSLLQELYNTNANGKLPKTSKVSMPEIVEETMEILSDSRIGMDTCMRKLDRLKEKTVVVDIPPDNARPARLDLLSKFR